MPAGTHLIEVAAMGYFFSPVGFISLHFLHVWVLKLSWITFLWFQPCFIYLQVRVDVSARNRGKVQAALTETRRGLSELVLEPLREEQYYEVG